MHYLAANVMGDDTLRWQHMVQFGCHEEKGITITIQTYHRSPLKAAKDLAAVFAKNEITWLRPTPQGLWLFNSGMFKAQFPDYVGETWLTGDLLMTMDHDYDIVTVSKDEWQHEEPRYHCQFAISPALVEDQMPQKIFLSHKGGADKPMVRRYKAALEAIRITAWLDEDAMHNGVYLERAILQGFKESCAAVFFITPRFLDEGFLATEISYAIGEWRDRGARFRIVTLLIPDPDGSVGSVLGLLTPYLRHRPETELAGFIEIVRALPLAVGPAMWKV